MDTYECTNCKAMVVCYVPAKCPKCKETSLKKKDVGYDPSFYNQADVFHPTISC
jgi:hypothetical protein